MEQTRKGQDLASLLRAYRRNARLTQEQLAERAGLSRRGIADLERGARRAPYAHTLEQLRTALELSEAEHAALLEAARRGDGPKQPAPPAIPAREATADMGPQHNLPRRPNSFIGREADRARVTSLLGASPLVTLLGPGGVGKTRLALEIAEDEVGRWQDGIWLVELAALTKPTIVPVSIAAVLDVQQRPGGDLLAHTIEWLRNKQLLLVLDNCEHVVAACAHIVGQIVRSCPDVRVLATSREVLGAEWRGHPPGGSVRNTCRTALSAKEALESEAVPTLR